MTPYPHQIEYAERGLPILKNNGLVYYAMEERTGKTLTSILLCEMTAALRILVVTKKKAMDGWNETIDAYKPKKEYVVINYHSVDKVDGIFDLVILDEAHSYISGYPKRSGIWKKVLAKVSGLPIIYMSATPHAQGRQLLFNQLALCSWSPFRKYANYYRWYADFAWRDKHGQTEKLKLHGRFVETYKKVNDEMVKKFTDHLFVTATRRELGFEHEPEDMLHYIELSKPVKTAYNLLMKDEILEFEYNDEDKLLVCDSNMKLRTSLHMLEGGVLKVDEDYLVLNNNEKVNYIKENWGDNEKTVIMYNYKAERKKLEQHFKKALLLQATSYAEGVDLSGYDNLIIYSQDFSSARHTQRRARQANKKRDTPITVHFLLVKKGLSEQVYKTVSKNKKNFVDSVFERTTI